MSSPSPHTSYEGIERLASACTNCRRVHKYCNKIKPCDRCVRMGLEDSCGTEKQPSKKDGKYSIDVLLDVIWPNNNTESETSTSTAIQNQHPAPVSSPVPVSVAPTYTHHPQQYKKPSIQASIQSPTVTSSQIHSVAATPHSTITIQHQQSQPIHSNIYSSQHASLVSAYQPPQPVQLPSFRELMESIAMNEKIRQQQQQQQQYQHKRYYQYK